MRHLKRLFELLRTPSGLAGAFIGATVLALVPGGVGVLGLVLGWLYGIVVGALIRLFRAPGWAAPILGLFVGPVPIAFFIGADVPGDARGIVVVGILAGPFLGFAEWMAARRAAAPLLGTDERA
jgi:hypothetical protein